MLKRVGMCARASEGSADWLELQAASRAIALAVGIGMLGPPLASAERCPPPRLRAIQDAAARNLGLTERPRWRARARWSALLPAVTVRADRGIDWREGGAARVDPVEVDHDLGAGVRLTWRLDQLVYDRDEPRLLAAERAARRARVTLDQEVTQLYFRWRRAAIRDDGPALDEAETFATLDAVTGGWLAEQQTARCP